MRATLPGCVDSAGKGLRPAEKRQSRADGHMCPSARSFMVLRPVRSPYETSTNRRECGLGGAAPAVGVWVVAASSKRRLVQVSCGWPRVAAPFDPRAPAGSQAASGCAGAPARDPRSGHGRRRGCPAAHFFRSVACLFANEPFRAHFLRFVAGVDTSEAPRLRPFRAKPQVRRTITNVLSEGAAPRGHRATPKGAEPAHNRATNRKKRARNRFPPTRPLRAGRTLRLSVASGRPRVVRGRAGAPGRRPPPAAAAREPRARAQAFGRTFFEVRCSARRPGVARGASVSKSAWEKCRSEDR